MRKILVAVAGLTPQIITETLYYYGVEAEPRVQFAAVHVLTTRAGKQLIEERLLGPKGAVARLCQDYGLPPVQLDASTLHLLGSEQPLDDIRNSEDNARMAEEIAGLIRQLSEDPETALYCSIAGGRKTMGVYLALALQIYGRDQDRLSHVLVKPEFEAVDDFYFPPKQPRFFQDRRGNQLDSRGASIDLAEIPFVSARKFVSGRSLKKFQDAIVEARRNIGLAEAQPKVVVDLVNRALYVEGQEIEFPNQHLAWYAAMLWQKAACGKDPCDDCSSCFVSDDAAMEPEFFTLFLEIYELLNPYSNVTSNKVDQYREAFVIPVTNEEGRRRRKRAEANLYDACGEIRSRINTALPLQSGRGLPWIMIQRRGERGNSRYGVAIDRENIQFIWPQGHPGGNDFGLLDPPPPL